MTGAVLASVPAVATAGLLAEPTRAAARLARSAGGHRRRSSPAAPCTSRKAAAVSGTRAVGTVVTGADPIPDGHVRHLADVARGMLEPPLARHTRRIWADRGHVHIEVAAPSAEEQPEVRRALRRHLERLEGVEWATVNDVVGRVLVGIDDRRVSVEEVVGVVTAIEQARGARQVFPQRQDHPGDLEPLMAAVVTAAVDTAAVGVAFAGKVLPVPAVTRHLTLAIALLDSQQWLKDGLEARIGPIGTDLAFTGTSALLHALTQSPSMPAINAAAAVQQALEIRARRQVWRRREPELCRPEPEPDPAEPLEPPGSRPAPLPRGPIETYRARLGPTALGGAVGLLPLTRRPGRSADLLKALTPKAGAARPRVVRRRHRPPDVPPRRPADGRLGLPPAGPGRHRRAGLRRPVHRPARSSSTRPPTPRAGTPPRSGPPPRISSAGRRRGARRGQTAPGCGSARRATSPDAPGGEVRTLLQGRRRVGRGDGRRRSWTRTPRRCVTAVTEVGHRLVLTPHVGTREIAGGGRRGAARGRGAGRHGAPAADRGARRARRVGHGRARAAGRRRRRRSGPGGAGPGLGRRPGDPARPRRRLPAGGGDRCWRGR